MAGRRGGTEGTWLFHSHHYKFDWSVMKLDHGPICRYSGGRSPPEKVPRRALPLRPRRRPPCEKLVSRAISPSCYRKSVWESVGRRVFGRPRLAGRPNPGRGGRGAWDGRPGGGRGDAADRGIGGPDAAGCRRGVGIPRGHRPFDRRGARAFGGPGMHRGRGGTSPPVYGRACPKGCSRGGPRRGRAGGAHRAAVRGPGLSCRHSRAHAATPPGGVGIARPSASGKYRAADDRPRVERSDGPSAAARLCRGLLRGTAFMAGPFRWPLPVTYRTGLRGRGPADAG